MKPPSRSEQALSVFINCPFDFPYEKFFRAIVFAVHDCGFIARCAKEINDGSEIRLSKIFRIISECNAGIHDISRTGLDTKYKLPRFNMPLELGMFLGAKQFGRGQGEKRCLILDTQVYRYQKYCSDIAGQDIGAHKGNVKVAIALARDFLRSARPKVMIPGGARIFERYLFFCQELPAICERAGLENARLTFHDFATVVSEWLKVHARP